MGGFVKGDVVVLPFPFSDLSSSKKRPALVLATAHPHEDVILCMITSKQTRDASAIPITQADFAAGRLPRDSNIRPNRLFTADVAIILRTAGKLSAGKIDETVTQIITMLAG